MSLLQWADLSPHGPSNLAAVRFSAPCRVRAIKIFPTGATPFASCPHVVAQTRPDSFFMDVYFNAHPVPGAHDGKHKLRAPNALIPTVIAYSGGHAEFSIDMGADFGTRLMIVRGDFECVSLAIYGEVVTDTVVSVTSYTSHELHLPEPVIISPALDLANASDPTHLARQLLALIPDAPSLNLVIRLMFCLKPPNDDWDLPEYPHLYSDLNEEDIDIDLDSAFRCLSRPVAEDVPPESLQRFAEKISDAIGPMDDTQAYLVSGILCRSASQSPHFSQALMQSVDLENVFDVTTLNDEDTICTLLDASTNHDISELLNVDWFRDVLRSVELLPTARREVRKGARRLTARLRDWQVFEDALSNPEGNFADACQFLKEVGTEEKSFGIWLSCMTLHGDLWATVREGPPRSDAPFSSLLDPPLTSSISHGDFIGFVRAYIGVASVLAVYAWSDSLPNDHCRERTLGVLKLWQDVPGYREIVNHLLLLRQMTFRLECMTIDNDPPAQSGIHAESIILNLVDEPRCYLSSEFVKCLRCWQPFSLTYISEEERISLYRAATIADDGLLGAIEELVRMDSPAFDLNRIRGLRVAVAVILHELGEDEGGGWNVLDVAWRGGIQGMVFHVIDMASSISKELKTLCLVNATEPREPRIVEQLLLLADEVLPLVIHFEPFAVTSSRTMRGVVVAIVDIFACADIVLSQSPTSSTSFVGKRVQQTCVAVLCRLSELWELSSPGRGPELFLRTLFEYGFQVDDTDPARRILQVYTLVDHLIPDPSSDAARSNSRWVISVMPLILNDLSTFFRYLDVDYRLDFLNRLVSLDNGILNVGEWLLAEELKHMANIATRLSSIREPRHALVQYEVNLCLQFIVRLTDTSSEHSKMCTTMMCTMLEASQALTVTITSMLSARLHSTYLLQITRTLVFSPSLTDPAMKLAVALALIRGVAVVEFGMVISETFDAIRTMLSTVSDAELALDRLLWEFGCCLSSIAESGSSRSGGTLDSLDIQSIVRALDWLCSKLPGPSDLPGLSWDKWDKLCEAFQNGTTPDMYPALKAIKGKLTPLPGSPISTTVIPDARTSPLVLSLHALGEALRPTGTTGGGISRSASGTVAGVTGPQEPRTPTRRPRSLPPGRDRDVLGLVALSPPTALLRSPAMSGLSKTYTKNDFRELRQTPSARQNTSRMPSMHVDEFEFGAISASSSPLIRPQPTSASMDSHQVNPAAATMGVQPFGLGPPFGMS